MRIWQGWDHTINNRMVLLLLAMGGGGGVSRHRRYLGASRDSPWAFCPSRLPQCPPDTGCRSDLLSALWVATHPHRHKPPHWTFCQRQGVEPVNVAVPHGKGTTVAEFVLVHIWLQFDSETGSDSFLFWGKKKTVQSTLRLGLHSTPLSETLQCFLPSLNME